MKFMFDLVLDNGDLVRVECEQKMCDEVLEDVEEAMKRADWWGVRAYDGTQAKYRGHLLDRVNMARVVAML